MLNVLPLTYLGSVRYFAKLCFGDCVIDVHEHYRKQTLRNRCLIMSAGGVLPLTVHAVHGDNDRKRSTMATPVDYSKRWQHQHEVSIVSAYRGAPYFDHYWPRLEPLFHDKALTLGELDLGATRTLLDLLGCGVELRLTESYIAPTRLEDIYGGRPVADWRDAFTTKPGRQVPDPWFRPRSYWQVFSDRHPFAPDMSVVDLLFCEGPGALDILRESCVEC